MTYAIHGISGFPDHIVTHGVVKRAFLSVKDRSPGALKRRAFYTVDEEFARSASGEHRLGFSRAEEIDCVVKAAGSDVETFQKSLDCYKTYQEMIEKTGIRKMPPVAVFEIFGESFDPPLADLCDLG